jgi:hypothetical protein
MSSFATSFLLISSFYFMCVIPHTCGSVTADGQGTYNYKEGTVPLPALAHPDCSVNMTAINKNLYLTVTPKLGSTGKFLYVEFHCHTSQK